MWKIRSIKVNKSNGTKTEVTMSGFGLCVEITWWREWEKALFMSGH